MGSLCMTFPLALREAGKLLLDTLSETNPDAHISPFGSDGRTLIDGEFDLETVAKQFLTAIQKQAEMAPKLQS